MFDPHAYASGRWLRRDKLQRAAHYINFDFAALCWEILGLSPGASDIINCSKDRRRPKGSLLLNWQTDCGETSVQAGWAGKANYPFGGCYC